MCQLFTLKRYPNEIVDNYFFNLPLSHILVTSTIKEASIQNIDTTQ
jgi:hypothetical protein